METVRIEELTSPAVAAAIADGYRTAVVACGAVEQHGPHLPLFMDAEHGSELAERVARRLGDALVAPTIRVGCSEHHMAFAGTVTLRKATFQALCLDYAMSLSRHGFERIYFIPSHGGSRNDMRFLTAFSGFGSCGDRPIPYSESCRNARAGARSKNEADGLQDFLFVRVVTVRVLDGPR